MEYSDVNFDIFVAQFVHGKNIGYLIGDCLFVFASHDSLHVVVPRSLVFLIDPTSYIFHSTIGTNDCYLCIHVMGINRPKKLLSRGFLKYILIQNIKTEKKNYFNIISDENRNQVISNLMMNNQLIYKPE